MQYKLDHMSKMSVRSVCIILGVFSSCFVGVSLFCSQCDSMWMVCQSCPKLRNRRFLSASEMLNHNRDRHRNDTRPSPGSNKRSFAEVEQAMAQVCLPPVQVADAGTVTLPNMSPTVPTLPQFPEVLSTVCDGDVVLPATSDVTALSCSLFGKTLFEDAAVFHGLDRDSYMFDGLIRENSLLSFPVTINSGDGLDISSHFTNNSPIAVRNTSPSSENKSSSAVSSLLLLANNDGMQVFPLSPIVQTNVVVLQNVFEIPRYDADLASFLSLPDCPAVAALWLDEDSGIQYIPSVVTDDFVRRVDHRMMVLVIPRIGIITEFHCNMNNIPDSKFVYISDTELKQFSFERDYGTICGCNMELWSDFLDLLKPRSNNCKLNYLSHIDLEQVYGTAIYTNALMAQPQRPHVDFTWEVLLLASRRRHGLLDDPKCAGLKHGNMPYTGHMPLSSEGSFIYVWPGTGESLCLHIRYGTILFLRGDIVHCGGTPTNCFCIDKKYPRLHFYFLSSPADHPSNNVFYNGYDGESFEKDHYHVQA